ncbi:hypothetical protein ACR03S_15395 [Limimaricola variabilis]
MSCAQFFPSFHRNSVGEKGLYAIAGFVVQPVIGYSSFGADDGISEVSVVFDDYCGIFSDSSKMKEAILRGDGAEELIYEHRFSGRYMRVSFETITRNHVSLVEVTGTVIKISFDKPIKVSEIYAEILLIRSFLSMVSGCAIGLRDIYFYRARSDALSNISDLVENRFLWLNSFPVDNVSELRHIPLLRVGGNSERENFSNCLASWYIRGDKWIGAMMGALRRLGDDTYSGERLVRACSWLEDIPIAKPTKVMATGDVGRLKQIVSDGLPSEFSHLSERIGGLIGAVANESHRERVSRLFPYVARAGLYDSKDEFVRDVVEGLRRRGKFAHGHKPLSKSSEFSDLVRQIDAVETLCYCIMFFSLPLSGDYSLLQTNHPIRRYVSRPDRH